MTESLEIISTSQSADVTESLKENKNNIADIICTSTTSYFPSYFLGDVIERYTTTIDYMVGMDDFEKVFEELNINDSYIKRDTKIYNVLDKKILKRIGRLNDKKIKKIGNYTNRIDLSTLYSIFGFEVHVMKHFQQYHVQEILSDIEKGIIHGFIQLTYKKTNLIVHLFPFKCMEEKNISYGNAMSYCVSIMWATLINIVQRKVKHANIISILKEVFHRLNPIPTKMVFYTKRTLTPDGYSFVQEFEQLTPAYKFIQFKTAPNHIINKWTPCSDRFENYIYKTYRTQTKDWDASEDVADLRGDSNGRRFVEFDCKIKNNFLMTKVTIVGQNLMRDITGYYTTPIYGLICDDEVLEDYELSSLFTILTGTKEYQELFNGNLMKAYVDVKTEKIKFVTHDTDMEYDNEKVSLTSSTAAKSKRNKRWKSLSEIMEDKNYKNKDYTMNMVCLATEKTSKEVFLDLKPNNNYYIAIQLIEKFNMKRNVPKDIMDVIRKSRLSEKELEESLELVERHKRPKIREMVEFVKTLEPPKHIIHEIYNYLWQERYI